MPPRGCSLMTAIGGNDPAKEAESLTRLIDAGVDGLVASTPAEAMTRGHRRCRGRTAVVLLDRDVADGGIDSCDISTTVSWSPAW